MQRKENESFEDYKIRRAENNAWSDAVDKGHVRHDSMMYGTYVNTQKADKKAKQKALGLSSRQFKKEWKAAKRRLKENNNEQV